MNEPLRRLTKLLARLSAIESMYQYFLHFTYKGRVGDLLEGFREIEEQQPDSIVIEDAGRILGGIRSSVGGDSSPDGCFAIVRVKDDEALLQLMEFLGTLGCENISSPQMFPFKEEKEDQT